MDQDYVVVLGGVFSLTLGGGRQLGHIGINAYPTYGNFRVCSGLVLGTNFVSPREPPSPGGFSHFQKHAFWWNSGEPRRSVSDLAESNRPDPLTFLLV